MLHPVDPKLQLSEPLELWLWLGQYLGPWLQLICPLCSWLWLVHPLHSWLCHLLCLTLQASAPMAWASASGPMALASVPMALPWGSSSFFLKVMHVCSHIALSACFLLVESQKSNSLLSFPSISVSFSPSRLAGITFLKALWISCVSWEDSCH